MQNNDNNTPNNVAFLRQRRYGNKALSELNYATALLNSTYQNKHNIDLTWPPKEISQILLRKMAKNGHTNYANRLQRIDNITNNNVRAKRNSRSNLSWLSKNSSHPLNISPALPLIRAPAIIPRAVTQRLARTTLEAVDTPKSTPLTILATTVNNASAMSDYTQEELLFEMQNAARDPRTMQVMCMVMANLFNNNKLTIADRNKTIVAQAQQIHFLQSMVTASSQDRRDMMLAQARHNGVLAQVLPRALTEKANTRFSLDLLLTKLRIPREWIYPIFVLFMFVVAFVLWHVHKGMNPVHSVLDFVTHAADLAKLPLQKALKRWR